MANYVLDITRDVCPLTFVKTKLLLERMASGETAEIRLKGAEPLENVPRSVRDVVRTASERAVLTPSTKWWAAAKPVPGRPRHA